ncbi:MAG: hypothetical protein QOF63_1915 [Thermoanaerobaculia bacterium]|jgi:hypothetical protein|nr:hypothetical protein [Thermoanaerobaculia bacterium]
MTSPAIAALFDALWPAPLDPTAPSVFALIDAARDEQIYPALLKADGEWCCLYRGDAAVTMAEVAPYLVELDPHARFTSWLLKKGWGNSWCVFLHAGVTLERLQAHFRRLVMAQLPDGKMVYFRFYDPRVLRAYLPTCTAKERELVFGPVDRYVMEGEDPEETVVFTLG